MHAEVDITSDNRLFGTNGIRGVVNQTLTPDVALKIAESIGTFFDEGEIIIGYDSRTSNTMLVKIISSGLAATGCNIHVGGLAPTPCIQHTARNRRLDGGVMITASHNPPQFNGIKVLGSDGVEISRQEEAEIEETFCTSKLNHVDWQKIGKKDMLSDAHEEYKKAIKRHIDCEIVERKRFRVVVDPVNGVGGLITPNLLKELGCQVTTINADIDGRFPSRPPEPRPENLQELSTIVKARQADLGVAFDGDADRAIFVDEKGEVQWGDRTFALIEEFLLETEQVKKIVTPISSSQIITDVAEKHGAEVILTKVGSTAVSHTMKKTKAKLGGEENGGVFYGPHQPVRDGAMTTALLLNVMARTQKKLSDVIKALPQYFLEKDTIKCPTELKSLILKKLTDEVRNENLTFDTIDGVKIRYPNASSILIRPSGTEPLYRFYAEAKTKDRASKLVRDYRRKLSKLMHA
ncbi:MAG: phosphoglucosamine mutase [Candidatus Bathyarchaeota archaeon]|nr:MAG: phosphoglucosamine mutase [Candidatus Bathyarchaeota archaeon]